MVGMNAFQNESAASLERIHSSKVFFRALLRRMKGVRLLVGVKQRGAEYDELA